MIRQTFRAATSIAALLLAGACVSATGPLPRAASSASPPPIAREMRGIWVATVANIDWPSSATLTADQQRAELVDLFNRAAAAGFNTIVFQVRPAADAVYRSSLEPWASLLTGTQGRDPGYDPLEFAIEQAHARGLELHAWINPFRAGKTSDTANFSPTHVFNTHRDLIRIYGSQVWMDPGEAEVQEETIRVVRDLVQRYDIDGIHADDYFYPYQEQDARGKTLDFPDSATYAASGTTLSRDDWRRANIDRFVERLYHEVHSVAPTLKVGLSPFGIWRPGNPPSVMGLDAYATIYADSRKWLRSGWVDYLAPQLYWAIDAPQQSYPALLDWWLGENAMGRSVWPGLAAYRVNDGTTRPLGSNEIADQIRLTRDRANASGEILYNASSTLKRNGGAIAGSVSSLYTQAALVPAEPWLGGAPPGAPSIRVTGRDVSIIPADSAGTRWWYVRAFANDAWETHVLFGSTRSITLAGEPERVLVNAVDRTGITSADVDWKR